MSEENVNPVVTESVDASQETAHVEPAQAADRRSGQAPAPQPTLGPRLSGSGFSAVVRPRTARPHPRVRTGSARAGAVPARLACGAPRTPPWRVRRPARGGT